MNLTAKGKYHLTEQQIADEASVIAAAKKNPEAFRPLYDQYYTSIFRYVFKRMNNEADTADITSKVFLKALNKISGYESRGVPFSAWLFRIAYSEVNDFYRKKPIRTVNVEKESILDWLSEPEVEDESNREEKLQWAIQAIKNLKPEHLDLIEMRFFEGRSFKEIGNVLDITENTAKVRCHRITERLANEWKKNNA